MAEWLESGIAELWGGRSFRLPRCAHDRKPDGSWSAWGSDWAADVHIIETSGTASGASFTAHEMIDERTPGEPIEGLGWSGRLEVLTEQDGDRPVFRMAAGLWCHQHTDVAVRVLPPRRSVHVRTLRGRQRRTSCAVSLLTGAST